MSQFINSTIINLSIIVSSILTFYFSSIGSATSSKRSKLNFISDSARMNLSPLIQIFVGICLGLVSFLLSVNKIQLWENATVDMRYVIIFFSVYYASILTGGITSLTLIITKTIQYRYFMPTSSSIDFWNNILLTILLYLVSIFITKNKLSSKNSILIFLGAYILARTATFVIVYYPIDENSFFTILVYFVLFSIIFLLTSFIINSAVAISRSVHVYRSAAIYDSLTNLYNRESFDFFLDQASIDSKKWGHPFSIAVLDLDNFKEINDTYGHAAGDAALKHFSATISSISFVRYQKVCRIGGDEFGMVLYQEENEVMFFLNRIQEQLQSNPLVYLDKKIELEVSIGVAHFDHAITSSPDFDIEKAFVTADEALYIAKTRGKNQIFANPKQTFAFN